MLVSMGSSISSLSDGYSMTEDQITLNRLTLIVALETTDMPQCRHLYYECVDGVAYKCSLGVGMYAFGLNPLKISDHLAFRSFLGAQSMLRGENIISEMQIANDRGETFCQIAQRLRKFWDLPALIPSI